MKIIKLLKKQRLMAKYKRFMAKYKLECERSEKRNRK